MNLAYRSQTPSASRGFTLTEALVVLSIVAMLIGLTFPTLKILQKSGREEAGQNTVSMSVDVARQWVSANAWVNDNSLFPPSNESYTGTAALFCPTGEVRIVYNIRNARDNSNNFLEDLTNPVAKNGYADVFGIDYIVIPNGVGLVGIHRTGANTNDVELIAPPFAIAFDGNGSMYFGDTTRRIYYNGDGSGNFDTGTGRTGAYNPDQWTGEKGALNQGYLANAGTNPTKKLPFDAMECVPGVIIYDKNDYASAEGGFGSKLSSGGAVSLTSDAGQWLRENGTTLFFSPSTGIALREEVQ